MFQPITSLNSFLEIKEQIRFTIFYFSHQECNVCKVIKPKLEELIENNFPEIQLFYCDTVVYPEIAAQNQVFTVPTIVVFIEGKEFIRKSRNFGIEQLKEEISRPYEIIFGH